MRRGSAEGGRPWAKEEAEPAAIMKAAEGERRDKMKRLFLSSTGDAAAVGSPAVWFSRRPLDLRNKYNIFSKYISNESKIENTYL